MPMIKSTFINRTAKRILRPGQRVFCIRRKIIPAITVTAVRRARSIWLNGNIPFLEGALRNFAGSFGKFMSKKWLTVNQLHEKPVTLSLKHFEEYWFHSDYPLDGPFIWIFYFLLRELIIPGPFHSDPIFFSNDFIIHTACAQAVLSPMNIPQQVKTI